MCVESCIDSCERQKTLRGACQHLLKLAELRGIARRAEGKRHSLAGPRAVGGVPRRPQHVPELRHLLLEAELSDLVEGQVRLRTCEDRGVAPVPAAEEPRSSLPTDFRDQGRRSI